VAERNETEGRTEEPTEKRLADAIDRGSVPFSREAVTLASLLAVIAACKLLMFWSGTRLAEVLALLLGSSGSIGLEDREAVAIVLAESARQVGTAVLPVFALLALGGILGSLLQNVPRLSARRIAPARSRISPSAQLRRLFGSHGLFEFLKSLVKFAAVAAITFVALRSDATGILGAMDADPAQLPRLIGDIAVRIVAALCIVALVLAAADIAWSRYTWRRDLRMTRREVQEERRQSEGDPHVKSRIRLAGRQRAKRRMMAKLPTATVVVSNPTHYAVALRYVRQEGGAPVVVAKGLDHLALRIREVAAAHAIPVVEDRPLARSLYEKVDIDEAIPAELYRAVAEIIHFLMVRRMYTAPPALR
jgi:flagellar biosynthetic protein FlhB